MATTRTFNALLNQYLTDELIKEELIKRDYFLSKAKIRNDWKGGTLVVPFKGGGPTSVKFGALTGSTDISEATYVRGTVSTQPEAWASLILNQRDLQEHDGKIPESTFLKILPGYLEDLIQYFKEVCSTQLMAGPYFASATDTTDAATGVFVVDRVERFNLGQKCIIDDSDSNTSEAYVIGIDVNTKKVTFSDSRGGSAFNFSAYVTATVRFYHDGVTTNAAGTTFGTFTSMKSVLLSSANGGDATVHSQTKTSAPILQAYNESGAAITSSNILEKLFDFYVNVQRICRGSMMKEFLMSYKHLGSIMKALEDQKGSFKVTKDPQANMYGWTTITIASLSNGVALNCVACQEMDDDVIFAVNWDSIFFYTNGFIKKRISPDGKMYFEVRNTTGYQYIVDICLFGDSVFTRPSDHGVLHTINY